MSLDRQTRIWMLETMLASRHMDDRIMELYYRDKTPVFDIAAGLIPGEIHSSHGQEACAVGTVSALTGDDWITATHRPHHTAVARGLEIKQILCEIMGKANGLSGGKGGHMHLYSAKHNFSSSGIIAEGMGPAAGMALACRMQGNPGVGVCFLGEAAVNQGAFHEVMNMAGVYKLPFVCVVEDNNWGVSVAKSASTAVARNSDRAAAYNALGLYVDTNDPEDIHAAMSKALRHTRSGSGPVILELKTYRLQGHMLGDPQHYVPDEEKAAFRDCTLDYRAKLEAEGVLTASEADELQARVKAEVDEAVEFAIASPLPDAENALSGNFVDEITGRANI
ncbi:thiamine pyrophosphate-dependent dehydrogenase E1 component subunit alpha [Shewanella corallii]|uniref:Thiamine pyrophosphate-dependent dehydrogenase E1 component subunit alpha n=1 Tax=Shewanella corallii TaxID=560080 RepID=A0ABT0NBL8_9GAMM|nr:thiamine pyrophosphate-dependent dehydrogenase E1 component subunit alpha [Shewanella corallii]MCL2915490.1 thiamine pyrophosphate-dependent dehydrogenase E1 component subunit alpha [Shewanella corallii]